MIDFTKPVQTKDGRKVEIYSTDNGGDYPVHGRIFLDGYSVISMWTKEGEFHVTGCGDMSNLINTPIKHVRYVNMYSHCNSGIPYETKAKADTACTIGRIACIRIEFEEGEGLS